MCLTSVAVEMGLDRKAGRQEGRKEGRALDQLYIVLYIRHPPPGSESADIFHFR